MAKEHGSNNGVGARQKELLKDPDLRTERCEQYLSTLHVALWGQAFDLFDENRRTQAAQWLSDQIGQVMDA